LVETKFEMNVLQTVGIGLSLVCLLDCVVANGAQPLPLRTLKKGAFSGIREAKQEVVQNADAWEKLWKQHATATGEADKIPAVDFSKEMVIAATLGTKRTGGYAIEITGVEPKGKTLKITVKKTSPPPDAMTIQSLTAPFHFVAVPKSKLKPEFVNAMPDAKN
jgi:hypothetical protein